MLRAVAHSSPPDPLADAQTLVQVLARRAGLTPHRTALQWGEGSFSFEQLWRGVNAFAATLAERGVGPGDRVVLVIPNEPGFFFAFYGAQRLGAVPVPLFHLTRDDRIAAVGRHLRPKALVLPSETHARRRQRLSELLHGQGVAVLDAPADPANATSLDLPYPEPDDLAFLQYTSGSTGDAKAVQLTHRKLVTNVRQMIAASKMVPQDVFVNWVPVYHDMGLVVMSMCSLYLGARLVLLPVSLKVDAWLTAIQAHRGTVTAAPDFAYRYCVKFTPSPPPYDLSSLRLAINGAEPVRARTVASFEAKFGLRNVVKPGYGLAEAGVGVSIWDLGSPSLKVDERGMPSVGPALPDVEIAIADERGFLPSRQEGEIVVRGPSNASGYFEDPEASRLLDFGDGFIRTGDLGYVDEDGDLFVVGRIKNIIIRGGQNLAPAEVEQVVDTVPGVRTSAAVGVDTGAFDGEQVVVCVELADDRTVGPARLSQVRREIVARMHQDLGFRPNQVLLLRPGTIPRTHNGKIRHALLRQRYLDGWLERSDRLLMS